MAASWTEKLFVAKYVLALWNYNGKYFRPSPKQFGFALFYLMIEKKLSGHWFGGWWQCVSEDKNELMLTLVSLNTKIRLSWLWSSPSAVVSYCN